MKIIVADSSTLIALLDSGNIKLLIKLFDNIIITHKVYEEITCQTQSKQEIEEYISSGHLVLVSVEHEEMYDMLTKRLDAGESESIVLAKRLDLPLIIDERKGRQVAKSLDIRIIGLVGIILKLIEKSIITKEKAIEIVRNIEENNFRLSDELKNMIYEYHDTKRQ